MSDLAQSIRFLRHNGSATACVHQARRQDRALVESIEAGLGTVMNVRAVGDDFLNSWEAMAKCPIGLLVIPELAAVPERSFLGLKQFLGRGGAIFVSSRDFSMSVENGAYVPPFESRPLHDDEYFRRTAALLGAKPYTAAIAPRAAMLDSDFLPGLPPRISLALSPHGISWTTGSERFQPEPPYGHAFPERYPARRAYRVVQGIDPLGNALTTSALFCQDWETGARLVAVAFNGRESILDAQSGWSKQFLRASAEFCAQRIMIVSLDPGYACYQHGETADFTVIVKNFGSAQTRCEIAWEVAAGDTIRSSGAESIDVAPGESLRLTKSGFFDGFTEDEYTIKATLLTGGRVCSRAANGFVVWNYDTARRGPRFEVTGGGFFLI